MYWSLLAEAAVQVTVQLVIAAEEAEAEFNIVLKLDSRLLQLIL
jgi:hypothetical protein